MWCLDWTSLGGRKIYSVLRIDLKGGITINASPGCEAKSLMTECPLYFLWECVHSDNQTTKQKAKSCKLAKKATNRARCATAAMHTCSFSHLDVGWSMAVDFARDHLPDWANCLLAPCRTYCSTRQYTDVFIKPPLTLLFTDSPLP